MENIIIAIFILLFSTEVAWGLCVNLVLPPIKIVETQIFTKYIKKMIQIGDDKFWDDSLQFAEQSKQVKSRVVELFDAGEKHPLQDSEHDIEVVLCDGFSIQKQYFNPPTEGEPFCSLKEKPHTFTINTI